MSATHSWSRPVGTMPRARFGTTRQPWRESVVIGTNGRAPQAQQIVLAHQPQHAFVVHRKALATQLRGDPAVAVVPVRERQTLHRVTHAGLFLARRRRTPVAVVAGTADAGQRAHPLDRELALRHAGLIAWMTA